jgi:hypothetical protein
MKCRVKVEGGWMYIIAEYLTYLALVGMLGVILFFAAVLALVTRQGALRIVENSGKIVKTVLEVPRRLDPALLLPRHRAPDSH